MELEQAKKRVEELRAVIEKNNRLYYDQDAPELEDFEYDALTRELKELAGERGCAVLGTFGCKGYDTFGPFKLVGGLAKGRPDEGDLDRARGFFRDILTRL